MPFSRHRRDAEGNPPTPWDFLGNILNSSKDAMLSPSVIPSLFLSPNPALMLSILSQTLKSWMSKHVDNNLQTSEILVVLEEIMSSKDASQQQFLQYLMQRLVVVASF